MLKPYNKRWVKKGKQTSFITAMEQARVHVALGREHQAELADYGWPGERTEALASRVAELDERFSARALSTDASRGATQRESACRREAKEYIRTLQLAVPIILRDNEIPDITEDAFRTVHLVRSSKRISEYLMHVRPFVTALKEYLAPYFNGESPSARLEAVKDALDASDTAQETSRSGLPSITLEIRELNGAILEMVEDMNRVAKIAFRNRPDIAVKRGIF